MDVVRPFLALQSAFCILHSPLLAQTGLPSLERELHHIADSAKAKIGVGVIHLESGRELFLKGRDWFPLASTYKIPIAVEVLSRVDQGEWKLDSLVQLEAADIVPFGSLLTDRFGGPGNPGAILAIRRYLELMLILSDNTATDVLLRLMGGTAPVQARLTTLGIEGLNVSRSVMELGADWIGFPLPPRSERSLTRIRELMAGVKPAAHDSANGSSTPIARITELPRGWRVSWPRSDGEKP